MQIREAKESDIPKLAKIRSLQWHSEEFWIDRISGYLQGTHNPQKALPQRIIYLTEENNLVTGFIAGHLTKRFSCDGELQWINVLPEYQSKGLASELIKLLAKWFMSKNALRICVDVDSANTAARNFYYKNKAEDLNSHWLIWEDIRLLLK